MACMPRGQPQERGEARRAILRKVLAAGPLNFREVVRRSGIPPGTVVHHLGYMRRSGQASWQRAGDCVVWNLGAQPCTRRAAIEAIATARQRIVLAKAGELQGQPQSAVIDALAHMPRSSVQHGLDWGVRHGLLRYHVQGRYKLIQIP